MKRCPHCGETKPHDQYHRAKRYSDGLQPWCKACRSAHAKNTYEPEKARAYRAANANAIAARKRRYAAAHHEQELERAKAWHRAYPERVKEHKRRHSAKHGTRDQQRLERWVQANPERRNMGRKELRPKYVAWVMTRREPRLKPRNIPAALVAAKQQHLLILRELRRAT